VFRPPGSKKSSFLPKRAATLRGGTRPPEGKRRTSIERWSIEKKKKRFPPAKKKRRPSSSGKKTKRGMLHLWRKGERFSRIPE